MPPSEHKGLYEEHQELAQVLQETGRLLKRRGRTHKEVDSQIWRLAEFIESHFAREENDGYMAEALTRAPHLTMEARRLLAEHAELLEDAKKLQMLARFGVSLIFGALYQEFGPTIAFGWGAALALLAVVLLFSVAETRG